MESYTIKRLVKKYSDYIRYPIVMDEEVKDYDEKGEVKETRIETKTLNSMVPLWKRSKSDIKEEDYQTFYQSKFNDFQNPQKVIQNGQESH